MLPYPTKANPAHDLALADQLQPAHSLLTCRTFDPPSARQPPCTLGNLAHFSTKTAPFKVTHDNLIAKSTGFLSCLHSKHLTLPVPLLLGTFLSALLALVFLLSLFLTAGLPGHLESLLMITISRSSSRDAEWVGPRGSRPCARV